MFEAESSRLLGDAFRFMLGPVNFSDIAILCNKILLITIIWPKCFDQPLFSLGLFS